MTRTRTRSASCLVLLLLLCAAVTVTAGTSGHARVTGQRVSDERVHSSPSKPSPSAAAAPNTPSANAADQPRTTATTAAAVETKQPSLPANISPHLNPLHHGNDGAHFIRRFRVIVAAISHLLERYGWYLVLGSITLFLGHRLWCNWYNAYTAYHPDRKRKLDEQRRIVRLKQQQAFSRIAPALAEHTRQRELAQRHQQEARKHQQGGMATRKGLHDRDELTGIFGEGKISGFTGFKKNNRGGGGSGSAGRRFGRSPGAGGG